MKICDSVQYLVGTGPVVAYREFQRNGRHEICPQVIETLQHVPLFTTKWSITRKNLRKLAADNGSPQLCAERNPETGNL
jgi:hypothetical protein